MASIDFKALAQHLIHNAQVLLPAWLPGGKFEGAEYICAGLRGGPGNSFRYNIDKQLGNDFATGEGVGDMINLYAKINNIKMGEAAKQLAEMEGMQDKSRDVPAPTPKQVKPTDIIQPPEGVNPPDFNHFKHGKPSKVYTYANTLGSPIYYICRYETKEGKQFAPWSWSESQGWVSKGFPEPRPIYGLDHLFNNPDLRVLVVEGEKAADAARTICGKNYVVVTWPGGANAWTKADWTPIFGRKVLIWPDRDYQKVQNKRQGEQLGLEIGDLIPYEHQPGTKAAIGLAELLFKHCPEIKIINVEQEEMEGFDAADAVDKLFWTTNDFLSWAREHVKVVKDANTKPIEPEIVEPQYEVEPWGGQHGPPDFGDLPFEDVPMPSAQDEPLTVSKSMQALLPDRKANGKPLATIDNMREILSMNKVVARYNVIKKVEEVLIPGRKFSIDNGQNASLSHIVSMAAKLEFPLGQVAEYVSVIADENPYNPMATWITSKPWDGVNRLQQLYDTVKSANDPLKEILMYRWLISAVAAVFEPDGVVARGVLVFQAPQYLGKTMWFKSLVPAHFEAIADGMLLKPDDKDSVKQIVAYWLVELGELDATFTKSDIAQLKAFISKQRDKLRAAYARKESEYARRTVFFASVNPEGFLNDLTGNTRYWTVKCEAINHKHEIDMQQLWAEVYEAHYKQGVTWFLTAEEMAKLNESNESHVGADPVEEKIRHELDWNNPLTMWHWKTATQVLEMLGFDRPTRADATKVGQVMREINKDFPSRFKREGGVRLMYVPSVRAQIQDFPPMMPR